MFREYLNETKDITKEVIKLLKKSDSVMVIDDKGIMITIQDYDDGYFYGMDQFDNEVEFKNLKYFELG